MKIGRLWYDVEHEAICFRDRTLKAGDTFEVLLPQQSGSMVWSHVCLQYKETPPQGWFLSSETPELRDLLETCDPVGLFARQ